MSSEAMWQQLARMPLAQLASTPYFAYVDKVLELVAHWRMPEDDDENEGDENSAYWSSPPYTMRLARLLVVVARQCREHMAQLRQRVDALARDAADAHEAHDAAEARCAQREQDALREMHTLRALTQRSLDEARTRADAVQRERREEADLLFAEVAWLEGERRHWMHKVRVQPLLDAKVQRELQLTPAQQQRLAALTRDAATAAAARDDRGSGYERAYARAVRQRVLLARRLGDDATRRLCDAVRCALRTTTLTASDDDDAVLRRVGDVVRTQVERLLADGAPALRDDEQLAQLRDRVSVLQRERDEALRRRRDDDVVAAANATPPATTTTLARDESTLRALTEHVDTLQAQLRARDADAAALQRTLHACEEAQAALHDKLAAMTQAHDEVREQHAAARRACDDLQAALRTPADDDGDAARQRVHVLAGKVVMLRRREGQLRQRLQRALLALDEAAAGERATRASMATTCATLRAALEGGHGDGHVLPPSAATRAPLDLLLRDVGDALTHILRGRRHRDDRRFALQLLAVYDGMQPTRVNAPPCDDCAVTPRADDDDVATATATGDNDGEASVWRQRHALCARRLEDKTRECAALEQALHATQDELLHVKALAYTAVGAEDDKEGSSDDNATAATAQLLRRWGDEVARLKTINLALLQHSLDMQGSVTSLEIELECKTQELALARRSGDGDGDDGDGRNNNNDDDGGSCKSARDADAFAAAALREHAALRKRAERATLRARRLAVQLAASEANYQVVCNEATMYKQHAYKLYRRYVAQMVDAVDFVRHVQRERAAALSPHRVVLLQHRIERAERDLADAAARNTRLAGELSDCTTRATALEQQLTMLQQCLPRRRATTAKTTLHAAGDDKHDNDDDDDDEDAVARQTRALDEAMARQRASMTALRESARQVAEAEAERQHMASKLHRYEAHVRELDAEVARLQQACGFGGNGDDASLLQQLRALKDEVLAVAMQPPVAVVSARQRRGRRQRGQQQQPRHECTTAQGRDHDTGHDSDSDCDEAYSVTRAHATARRAQAQLQQRCGALQDAFAQAQSEAATAAAHASALRDDVTQLRAQLHDAHAQLAAERRNAQAREERVAHAHALQLDVAQRAAEHGRRCLQALLQKREEAMTQLQAELHAERSRAAAQQAAESARMEQLHEQLFREHATVVDRYRVAIQGDVYNNSNTAQQQQQQQQQTREGDGEWPTGAPHAATAATAAAADGGATDVPALTSQLRTLTAEVVRLQGELQRVRTTNVVLDGEVQRLVAEACTRADVVARAAHAQRDADDDATAQGGDSSSSSRRDCSVDVLASVLHSQNALLDSLRQRELATAEELQRERQQRVRVEQQLVEALQQHMEQRSALQLAEQLGRAATGGNASASAHEQVAAATTTTTAAAVQELRAHAAMLQQQLRETQLQLLQARDAAAAAQRSYADAQTTWQREQSSVTSAVAQRLTQLRVCSSQLRSNVDELKAHFDKLVLATSLLRQRLLDGDSGHDAAGATAGDDAATTTLPSHAHGAALVQRMGVLQREAAASMRTLEQRAQSLHDHVAAAATAATAATPTRHDDDDTSASPQTQRIAALQQQVADLTRRLEQHTQQQQQQQRRKTTTTTTTAAPPLTDEEVLRQTQVAAIVQRAVAKQQAASTQELLTLRTAVQTTRDALERARAQLQAERASVHALRAQLRSATEATTRATAAHARDAAAWQRRLSDVAAAATTTAAADAVTSTTTSSSRRRASVHDTATTTTTTTREAQTHVERGVDAAATAATARSDAAVGDDGDDARSSPPPPLSATAAVTDSSMLQPSPPSPPTTHVDTATQTTVAAAAAATTTTTMSQAAQTTSTHDDDDEHHHRLGEHAGGTAAVTTQTKQRQQATLRARVRAQDNELELLHATTHNAQLLMARLARENAELRARVAHAAQREQPQAQPPAQAHAPLSGVPHRRVDAHARDDDDDDGDRGAVVTRTSRHAGVVAELQRELAAARASARQYMLELHELRHAVHDDNSNNETVRAPHDRRVVRPLSSDALATSPTTTTTTQAVPPPLPRAPYTTRPSRHTAAAATSTSSLRAAHSADYHADMRHHHLRD